LSGDEACLLFDYRPIRCRLWLPENHTVLPDSINESIRRLSRNAYLTLAGISPPGDDLVFSSVDTISGKFVQVYYHAMVQQK
jgi:hypothetical protein